MVENQKCPKCPVTSAADYIFCVMGQDKILFTLIFNEVTFTKSEVNFSTLKRVYFRVQADLRSLVYMDHMILYEIGDLVIVELKLFFVRIEFEDSDKLDWVCKRHIHHILPLKMNIDFSSTGGGDAKVVPAVKNVSAVYHGSEVDAKTEICHITISMVKSPKRTQSAVINHKMVISNMRPKWSRKPAERFSDILVKGLLYEDRLDLSNMICSISYAQTADFRIYSSAADLLVVTYKMLPLASSWLIIMLLLLNAAKTFCTHFPYRSSPLCYPPVENVPFCLRWTSETGGAVIYLASTLMVLDCNLGSSRRPRVYGTDQHRPVGHFTSLFRIVEVTYILQ